VQAAPKEEVKAEEKKEEEEEESDEDMVKCLDVDSGLFHSRNSFLQGFGLFD